MPYRKVPLAKQEIYHIFTKSIAGFKIFNSDKDFRRMRDVIAFYAVENRPCKFSLFTEYKKNPKSRLGDIYRSNRSQKIVRIIAYCLMPTHIHMILQQLQEEGISKYVNVVLKSYSKYFNIKYNRKGPLWEGRFKNLLVETDEQFIHLTRYIHLNPVSISLVDAPENWRFSSYQEYLGLGKAEQNMCDFSDLFDMQPPAYREFVNERIEKQKELEKIKHLVFE